MTNRAANRTQDCLLGIDAGTSGLKVCLLEVSGRQAAVCHAPYKYWSPQPGWAQIDAESLWAALLQCLAELKTKGFALSAVRGIGISSLYPALTALGDNGGVFYDLIPYSDRRSTAEAEEILQTAGADRLFSITANGSMAGGFSGSSLLWLKHNYPEIYDKTRWFGHLNTFLALRMTGQAAIDPTNASYTNLFDTARGSGWSEELCAALGVDAAKLPPVIAPFAVCGGLRDPGLISVGVPQGTPVVIGAGDTPCAALAAGVTKAGDVCESAGTTNVLTVCTDKPVFDKRFINRCHIEPGTWVYQGSMSFTGAASEWFCRQFYEGDFARADREAQAAEPGCGGTVFLPYLQGERSPVWDPDARGVFFGMTLKTSRAGLYRAVLESCGYGMRQFLDLAEELTGRKIEAFPSIGGGSKSEAWTQIKADITGRAISVLDLDESAAAGAALLAGVGAGVWTDVRTASAALAKRVLRTFEPGRSAKERYERNYRTYLGLYPALRDLFAVNRIIGSGK